MSQLSPWDTDSNSINLPEKDSKAYKTPKYQPKRVNIALKAKENIKNGIKLLKKNRTRSQCNRYFRSNNFDLEREY